MERYFNTEGVCDPDFHYMVRLDDRIGEIKRLYIDKGKYFIINRGRQYGKTTTLRALAEYLEKDYLVLSMDFQEIGTAEFKDEAAFSCAFAEILIKLLDDAEIENRTHLIKILSDFSEENAKYTLRNLFVRLSKICENAPRPVIMMIDEVDSAANNQVFLDFLAMLRSYYLERKKKCIFHSVILAGVYDIKSLKLKLRAEEEHKYNSPWNISAKFDMDMSFSTDQIASMLWEYEEDKHIGMDVETAAKEIYQYTSGYPYLVSAVCKQLDEGPSIHEDFEKAVDRWTRAGIADAVKIMLGESIPLFESIIRQLTEYPDMKRMLYAILFQGRRVSYNPYQPVISLASMFGYIVRKDNNIQIANRIFETLLYNFFLSEEEIESAIGEAAEKNQSQFVENGKLNMKLVLEKFVVYYEDIYGGSDVRFLEEHGRKIFLLYLKPIINGTGNYYIEAQTRDARRTDVIVDYLGEQFIVEMKIWRGNEYNERGEEQLAGYLDYFHQKRGYMISFNFNKKKKTGMKTIQVGDKMIMEAVV